MKITENFFLLVIPMFFMGGCKPDGGATKREMGGQNNGAEIGAIRKGQLFSYSEITETDLVRIRREIGQKVESISVESSNFEVLSSEKISFKRNLLEGVKMSHLPYWKRKRIRDVQDRFEKLFRDAKLDAEKQNFQDPLKEKEWLRQWNDKNRSEVNRLKLRRRAVLSQIEAPKPSLEEFEDFSLRVAASPSKLIENDLLVISHLIDPEDLEKLWRNKVAPDSENFLHRAFIYLAKRYPQSVPDPKSISSITQ